MANANRMDVPKGTKQLIDAKLESWRAKAKESSRERRKPVFEMNW